MKKSLESAMPCPNRFMATAAYIAGSPVFIAAGSSTAPTRGTKRVTKGTLNRT